MRRVSRYHSGKAKYLRFNHQKITFLFLKIMNDDFNHILRLSKELSEYFFDGIIFIGGIASYLHILNFGQINIAESSHDSDFYISLADFADLRDIEQITPNRRLNKYQLIKEGVEFDIYVEHNHHLIVPYEDAFRNRVVLEGIPCVCLEHLLILKLEAYSDRFNSAKGGKDARDIIRIMLMLTEPKISILDNYLTENHKKLLFFAVKQPKIYHEICKTDFQRAVKIKQDVVNNLQLIYPNQLELNL